MRLVMGGRHLASNTTITASAFGRSRPAADASREVGERWLRYGCDVSVGHRRFPDGPTGTFSNEDGPLLW
jgi:hypothetical protein